MTSPPPPPPPPPPPLGYKYREALLNVFVLATLQCEDSHLNALYAEIEKNWHALATGDMHELIREANNLREREGLDRVRIPTAQTPTGVES